MCTCWIQFNVLKELYDLIQNIEQELKITIKNNILEIILKKN